MKLLPIRWRSHAALIGKVFTHLIDPAEQKFWQHLVALNQETPVGILDYEVVTKIVRPVGTNGPTGLSSIITVR